MCPVPPCISWWPGYASTRGHRRALRARWRRLTAGRQALLTLAHLRNGHTYAQLAVGFGVGTSTANRYITQAVELLDGTLLPIAPSNRARSIDTGRTLCLPRSTSVQVRGVMSGGWRCRVGTAAGQATTPPSPLDDGRLCRCDRPT